MASALPQASAAEALAQDVRLSVQGASDDAPPPPPPLPPLLGGAKGHLSGADAAAPTTPQPPPPFPTTTSSSSSSSSSSSLRASLRALEASALPPPLPPPAPAAARPRALSTAGLFPYKAADSASEKLVARRLLLGSRLSAGLSRGDRCCLALGGACSLRLALALAAAALAALLTLQAPALGSPALAGNPVGAWLALAAVLLGADLALARAERALWAQVHALGHWLKGVGRARLAAPERAAAGRWLSLYAVHWLQEATHYLLCGEGHLGHLCLPVVALGLMARQGGGEAGAILPLRLPPAAASTYASVCAVALCVKGGMVLKNAALALIFNALEVRALGPRVDNALIAEELLCFLSAALVRVSAESGDTPRDLCALIPSFYLLSARSWHLSSNRVRKAEIECFRVTPGAESSARERANTLGEPFLDAPATPLGGGRGSSSSGGAPPSQLQPYDVLDLRGLSSEEEVEAAMGAVFDRIVDRRDERRWLARVGGSGAAPAPPAPPAPPPPGDAGRGAAGRITAYARPTGGLPAVGAVYYSQSLLRKEDLAGGLWVERLGAARRGSAGSGRGSGRGRAAAQPLAWFPGCAEDVDLAWRVLHSNGASSSGSSGSRGGASEAEQHLSREEFQHACVFLFRSWQGIKASLGSSTHGVNTAVAMVCEIVFWFAQLLIALGIFGVDFSAVLLPLLTLTVSLSFGLGPLLQRFLDSLMFTLVIAPYDVGDSVAIDGGAPCRVTALNLLTTEFCVKASNQWVLRRNSDLLASAIVNLSRSSDARFTVAFALDARTTSAHVGAIQARMGDYLKRHSVHWQDSVSLSAAHSASGGGRVDFTLAVTARATWGDAARAHAAYSALTLHLTALLQHLGLEHRGEAWGAAAAGGAAGGGAGACRVAGECPVCVESSERESLAIAAAMGGAVAGGPAAAAAVRLARGVARAASAPPSASASASASSSSTGASSGSAESIKPPHWEAAVLPEEEEEEEEEDQRRKKGQ